MEDGATRTAKADDLRALWEAVNAEREKASKHREAIIAQLGHVATRDDLEKMEARILQHLPPR